MMIDTGCCFDVAMIEQMSLGYGDAHWGCGSEQQMSFGCCMIEKRVFAVRQ